MKYTHTIFSDHSGNTQEDKPTAWAAHITDHQLNQQFMLGGIFTTRYINGEKEAIYTILQWLQRNGYQADPRFFSDHRSNVLTLQKEGIHIEHVTREHPLIEACHNFANTIRNNALIQHQKTPYLLKNDQQSLKTALEITQEIVDRDYPHLQLKIHGHEVTESALLSYAQVEIERYHRKPIKISFRKPRTSAEIKEILDLHLGRYNQNYQNYLRKQISNSI